MKYSIMPEAVLSFWLHGERQQRYLPSDIFVFNLISKFHLKHLGQAVLKVILMTYLILQVVIAPITVYMFVVNL